MVADLVMVFVPFTQKVPFVWGIYFVVVVCLDPGLVRLSCFTVV